MTQIMISFIGCPHSGKTTIAAMLFARLKELGVVAEYVPEQARTLIAEKRFELKLGPAASVSLSQLDQLRIFHRQLHAEEVMSYAVGDNGVVVVDSSALNTLLYMSECFREAEREKIKQAVSHTDIVFYCAPIPTTGIVDPNRVHNDDESKKIDLSIEAILSQHAPGVKAKLIPLTGDLNERFSEVMKVFVEKRMK